MRKALRVDDGPAPCGALTYGAACELAPDHAGPHEGHGLTFDGEDDDRGEVCTWTDAADAAERARPHAGDREDQARAAYAATIGGRWRLGAPQLLGVSVSLDKRGTDPLIP